MMKEASKILSDLEDARLEAVFLLEWSESVQKEADDLRVKLVELEQRVEDLERENLSLKIELGDSRNHREMLKQTIAELRSQQYVPVEKDLDDDQNEEDMRYFPFPRHQGTGWFTRIFF